MEGNLCWVVLSPLVYIYIAVEDTVIKRSNWDPINWWSFCVQCKVTVCFVDIGEILDHHCLKLSFVLLILVELLIITI